MHFLFDVECFKTHCVVSVFKETFWKRAFMLRQRFLHALDTVDQRLMVLNKEIDVSVCQ